VTHISTKLHQFMFLFSISAQSDTDRQTDRTKNTVFHRFASMQISQISQLENVSVCVNVWESQNTFGL